MALNVLFKKNFFFFICILFNLQMCQIILPDPGIYDCLRNIPEFCQATKFLTKS